MKSGSPVFVRSADGIVGARFDIMASPFEILIDGAEGESLRAAASAAADEADRIASKFNGNIPRDGTSIAVDDETADLLDIAAQAFDTSGGLFDITTGVLRRAWTSDGADRAPAAKKLRTLLSLVGWNRVSWKRPALTLPDGMEIDFGGIVRKYAVDRSLAAARAQADVGVLVNYGGNMAMSPRPNNVPWSVGIEAVDRWTSAAGVIGMSQGAIATTGDARRLGTTERRRHGRILNPQTGLPVEGSPRSVTVAAATCVEAGVLAMVATLKGLGAESFLNGQGVKFWCDRG